MRTRQQPFEDLERIIGFDFLRATEAAALNTLPWIGRGEKEKADAAACDAIRGMFDLVNICGEVVIGEGIKDNAPGIFKGEHLGTWKPGSHKFDLALDPIDGTTNVAKGLPGSICCLAAASPEASVEVSLKDIPTFYMMKLAYGEKVVRYMQRTGIDIVSSGTRSRRSFPSLPRHCGSASRIWPWWYSIARDTPGWSRRYALRTQWFG